MAKANHLEIYKHLKKTNCRECGVPTCMAFALALINGEKTFSDCPYLDEATANDLDEKIVRRDRDKDFETTIGPLKKEISNIDFIAVAKGLGAKLTGERLRINCLGKDFLVDKRGNLESSIHINEWVMMPMLKYIKIGGNKRLAGKWISFEELKHGATMARYFDRRCEEPMRQLADSHTGIFFDLIKIFGGKEIKGFSADFARVIHPLPRLPFLILYWKQEEQFKSKLKILFDKTADTYLDAHSIYVLGRGIVEMFKKILARHEEIIPALLAL